jgi:hypothetical protein
MPSKAEFAESLSTIEGSGAKAGTPWFPRADPVRHSVCLSGSFRLRRKIRVVWPRMILVSVSEGPLTSGPIASLVADGLVITEFVIGLICGGVGSILLLRWAYS